MSDIDTLNIKLDQIEENSHTNDETIAKILNIYPKVDETNEALDALKGRIETLEVENTSLKTTIAAIETKTAAIGSIHYLLQNSNTNEIHFRWSIEHNKYKISICIDYLEVKNEVKTPSKLHILINYDSTNTPNSNIIYVLSKTYLRNQEFEFNDNTLHPLASPTTIIFTCSGFSKGLQQEDNEYNSITAILCVEILHKT